MTKKASTHEESRFTLKGDHFYANGDWSYYHVLSESGRTVVGSVTQRSGGGWICTLPVYGTVDNGLRDVTKIIGHADGRGATPEEALAEADRKSLEGITSAAEAAQMELT